MSCYFTLSVSKQPEQLWQLSPVFPRIHWLSRQADIVSLANDSVTLTLPFIAWARTVDTAAD